MIKQLIEIAENAISIKKPTDTWTYDGMCYLFAKSIVSYAKMAYDNMILGHFDATNMIVRTIIENNMYCWDKVGEDFDIITDEIEVIIYDYLNE